MIIRFQTCPFLKNPTKGGFEIRPWSTQYLPVILAGSVILTQHHGSAPYRVSHKFGK